MSIGRQYVRTSEVAALLGCSKQYVIRLIKSGDLASHQIGEKGWHRVSVNSLRRYAGARRIPLDFDVLDQADSTS